MAGISIMAAASSNRSRDIVDAVMSKTTDIARYFPNPVDGTRRTIADAASQVKTTKEKPGCAKRNPAILVS